VRRTTTVAAGLLALSCGWTESALPQLAPASADMPNVDLQPAGAPVIRLLDRLDEAALDVAEASVDDLPTTREHKVSEGCASARTQPRRVWLCPLPIELAQVRYAQRPDDLDLLQGAVSVPYVHNLVNGRPAQGAHIAWSLARGGLVVAAAQAPEDLVVPLVFRQSNADQEERRLNRVHSGLSTTAFVRLPITKGRETRDALLLPAPSTAAFVVEVGVGATLRFGWGVAPTPAKDQAGQARMAIAIDGVELWTGNANSAEDWRDESVDLSAFAGQTISVSFQTTALRTPHRAYAAFAHPEIVGAATDAGPSRVVVIGLDTLRPDHLQTHGYARATSPGMQQIAAASVVFTDARAPAPRTRPSFRTATTGRWPLAAIHAPTLGEILAARGFTTAGFVANVQLSPRLGFADGYGTWSDDNMANADVQVDRTLAWLEAHTTEDVAIFLHLMDPHVFYLAPKPFRDKFTDGFDPGDLPDKFNRWNVNRWYNKGQLSESQQGFIEARYDGEIAFMDEQLLRLVHALDSLPGRTLFVFHSDHGEEFFEHSGFEHNHSLYEEVVRTVLWVRPPGGWGGGPHRVDVPTSLADIVPTVLDLVGLPADQTPAMDGTSLAPFIDARRRGQASARSAALTQRPLHLGYIMLDKERWGVVSGGYKYILHTVSGQEELYDLTADPEEQTDLSSTHPALLPAQRQALAEATGWTVGTGWRIRFKSLRASTTLRFSMPIIRAGVIDPEADRMKRANLEWGERPPLRPSDVAEVTVTADRHSVRIDPGGSPAGTIFIVGPGADQAAQVSCGRAERRLTPGAGKMCGSRVEIEPGTIIAPAGTEADRLRAAPGTDIVHALKTLGYVE
jgi:arylsulfatase A-like enzyme